MWCEQGLKFECQRCGGCCRGEPGYVWVAGHEIEAMSDFMGLTADEFTSAYVRRVLERRSLKELPGGDCMLWAGTTRGCLAYPVRPLQCRTFPFWEQHLSSEHTWEALAKRCPGVNKGRVCSISDIIARLKRGH